MENLGDLLKKFMIFHPSYRGYSCYPDQAHVPYRYRSGFIYPDRNYYRPIYIEPTYPCLYPYYEVRPVYDCDLYYQRLTNFVLGNLGGTFWC